MRKRFLSVFLFGALLTASTGSFMSCKDYDDDIDGLSERIDANHLPSSADASESGHH